eukprot:gene2679-5272_t
MSRPIESIIMNILLSVLILYMHSTAGKECTDGVCKIVLKDHGLDVNRVFGLFGCESQLDLVAAGMRRKNLFVVEVDIYIVGVYLSRQKQDAILQDLEQSKPFDLVSNLNEDDISLVLLLRFVRGIGAPRVVDAIVNALSGSGEEYNTALVSFKNILLGALGINGLEKGEEIIFAFRGTEDLGIIAKGTFGGWVKNDKLRRRLADIYTGPKAVAPEVTDTLSSRFETTQKHIDSQVAARSVRTRLISACRDKSVMWFATI